MVNQLQEVQWAYLIDPCFQIENTAGRPNTGGWINIYIAGTRTKYYAASDFSGTLHPFNIPLDSLGSNIILVSPANKYDIYILNKYGTLVMSRYNVSPQVAGTSIVSGGVVLDSSDGTITIEQTGDNIYNLSVADIIDSVTANIDESITNIEGDIAGLVSGKKDIQAPYSASGSPTKTVTSVTQDTNGVITVTYSDIDLPQQVPNIEIESSTLDVVSSIDPVTNTKTFTIDTRSVTGDASFAYGDPTDTSYIASPRTSPVKLAGSNPVRKAGNDISYDGTDKQFTLKAGVYFVNFNVEASTNSVDDSTQQVYAEIAGNGTVHDRGTVTVDRTVSGQKSEIDLSSIIFAPNDNYVIEVDMGADSDVPIYGRISHWDIFRIDRGGISGGSVPGHEYLAGWGIEINQDDEISVDPTILDQYVTEGELATAIDNVIDTVTGLIPEAQVQADWDEDNPLDPSYINNKPDLDIYVTQEELASAVSGLATEYTAGSGIDITGNTISVDGTVALKSDIPEQEAVEFLGLVAGNNITLTESATGVVIDSTAGGSTYTAGNGIDISNDVISVNNDVAMKTDIPTQVNADWNSSSGVSEILNKPDTNVLVAGSNITITETSSGVVIDSTAGGSTYTAGTGIDISNDVISVDNTVAMKTDIPEQEAVEFTELTAGDNISIASGTISLDDVITINARGTSSGFAMFGNIVHWGEQDYGPGWAIAGHTDNGKDYNTYNTTDQGLQNFFWGEYGHDRDTASVSGESMIQISEGDIKYKQGDFQDVSTLPIIWSCSQMAQDISELQGAITAVTGVSADNIVDYDDADLFDKVEAIYNDGRSPIVRYTYNSTPGQGFPYSKETYFTEFFRYSEDNEHGHTDGYRFNYERHTGNYLENELIHFNSDGVKEHTLQHKSLEIKAGAGISVASGYDASTIISIDPTEVATAISGLLPSAPTYSAGNGIDITNNTISVDNTVALKSDIPDVSNFATETELQDTAELITGLIPDVSGLATKAELQDNIELVTGMIPTAQVQSDWAETDSSSPAYIKHKPDLEDYTSLEQFYETMNSSIADWTETTASAYSFIKNKPGEKELVAGQNIVITENASAIIINSTGGGGGGSDVFAGDGIEIASGVISVDNTVVRDQEFETASGNLVAYTDTASGNLVDYIDSIDKDAIFWVGGSTTYQAITDAIAANKIPVYLDTTHYPNSYGYLNAKGDNYYWFMAYVFNNKQLSDYDTVYNYVIYSDDRHGTSVEYTGINTVAGNGIDIARTYSSQSKQGFQTISIDAAEIVSSISGLLPSGPSYSAGTGIDITNGVISVDNTVAMKTDIPVIPDAAKNAVFANSYDNPGWETTGTVTSYNPLGIAIHPDLAYSSYTISASRLCVKNIGSGLFYLDLFVSMNGAPRAQYAHYQDYITIASGHFVCPTVSNVYDEWNNCFGVIHKDTLYGTGLDYNLLRPETPTNKHYIQLHAVVASW